MSEKGPSGRVELRRHGDKDAEGNLAPEGIARARSEAEAVFKGLLTAPADTIYYVVPSNVSRSQATRQAMEERFAELVQNSQSNDIVIVPFSKPEAIQKGAGKKYIVTGMEPSEAIGFTQDEPSNAAFSDFKKLYGGSEEYVAQTWIARADELSTFRRDMQDRFPTMTREQAADIRPGRFITTPEEIALKQLDAIVAMTQGMNDTHPGQESRGTYIGHAPAVDFLAMAVLGEAMTLQNFKRSQGLRKYLEASTFEIKDGSIVAAAFRGRSLAEGITVPLAEVRARLIRQSAERKAEWGAA